MSTGYFMLSLISSLTRVYVIWLFHLFVLLMLRGNHINIFSSVLNRLQNEIIFIRRRPRASTLSSTLMFRAKANCFHWFQSPPHYVGGGGGGGASATDGDNFNNINPAKADGLWKRWHFKEKLCCMELGITISGISFLIFC